jgi:hypothetical protein
MLQNLTNSNGVQTIDSIDRPFVRLPNSGLTTVFQGWGVRI